MSGALRCRDDEVRSARTRHPTARWQPDVVGLAARVSLRLATTGHPWPTFAAAVLAARGRRGLSASAFAASIGVTVAVVEAAEDGHLSPADAPHVLVAALLGEEGLP